MPQCWMFDYICVLRNPLRNTKSFRKFYLGAVLGVCLSTAVGLSSMGNNETSSDYVCWIMADTSTSHVRLNGCDTMSEGKPWLTGLLRRYLMDSCTCPYR